MTLNGAPRLRLLLGAFGDPGHAFPMLALGAELAGRGHEVTLQTWAKWADHVHAAGMRFAPAPEYHVFPTRERPLKPYAAVVKAAREIEPVVREARPHAVVADILTLAPALAAERAGVPVGTLIPHVYPVGGPGFPPYSFGARLPRTRAGRALWRAFWGPMTAGLARGRDELNETRARLGLAPVDRFHGGISPDLALVGTFPQLEYPRPWPAHTHVVGPLMWEPPAEDVELPEGEGPVVLVAPSTSQDSEQRLLRAALEGLADLPVRVLGTWNRRPPPRPLAAPANARLVEWVSYSRTMPRCDVVICHGGHGTVMRALSSGCAVVVCPAAGDMNENAARVDWAGVGVRLPRRWATPRAVALAVRRLLAEPERRSRARELAAWVQAHDPAARAADEVERFVT
jgi:UDP:flavonoid glycosyltransferase YjiC (YdhE family)